MKNSPQPTRASVYLYGMVVYSTIHRLAGNYPEADGYAEIEETHRVPGGETGNSAIVLARWGHRVKVAGPCLGRETRAGVQEFFAGRGSDCSGLPVDEAFDGVRALVLVGGATRKQTVPIAQPHGALAHPGLIQWRHPFGPMRGAHPLHAASFLVNCDDRIAADRRAQIAGQAAQLLGAFDIATEEDEAPGIGRAEEIPLGRREIGPGDAAEDRGAVAHCAVAGMQSVPAAHWSSVLQ